MIVVSGINNQTLTVDVGKKLCSILVPLLNLKATVADPGGVHGVLLHPPWARH